MQTRQMLYALGMASLALAAPAVVAAAPRDVNQVTAVEVSTDERAGVTLITIVGSQPFTPNVRAMRRPSATVITLPGVFKAGAGIRNVRKNGVSFVRCGQLRTYPDNLVQIVSNNRANLEHTLTSSADKTRWEISIHGPGKPAEAVAMKPAVAPIKPVTVATSAMNSAPISPEVARRIEGLETNQAAVAPAPIAPAPMAAPTLSQASASPSGDIRPANRSVSPRLVAASVFPARPVTPTLTEASMKTAPIVPMREVVLQPLVRVIPAVRAVPAPPKPVAKLAAATVVTAKLAATAPVQDQADTMVTVDFVNADIVDVLKAIALQSKVNIVAGSNVQGKVTVALQKVPLREALDWVTRLSGFRYARINNTFVVGSGADLALLRRTSTMSDAMSSSMAFFYSDGASLLASIKSAYPNVNITLVSVGSEAKEQTSDPNAPGSTAGKGNASNLVGSGVGGLGTPVPLQIKPRSGGVLNVVGTKEEVESVQAFIQETERGLIANSERDARARIERMAGYTTDTYEVRYVTAADMVPLLKERLPAVEVTLGPSQRSIANTLNGSGTFSGGGTGGAGGGASAGGGGGGATGGGATGGGTSGGGTGQANLAATMIIFTGPPADVVKAKELAMKFDTRVPLMEFQAEILEVNSSDVNQLGIAYDFTRPVNIGEQNAGEFAPIGSTATATPGRKPNFGAIGRTPYSISATVQALVQNNKANILARPKLTALDGQSAVSFIGDQFKYVINFQQTQLGPVFTTETANVGITLRVTAKSNGDGTMNLYVHPEISTVTRFLTVPGTSVQIPQISTRFVDTIVRVKDGETIAIGGLVRKDDFVNVQKVPILGDLPVIGSLFRSTDKRRNDTEILVFITSRISKE